MSDKMPEIMSNRMLENMRKKMSDRMSEDLLFFNI